jgi:hypothetical protein
MDELCEASFRAPAARWFLVLIDRTETDKGDKSGLLVKKLAVRWSGGLTRRRIDTNLFFEPFVETILFDF